MGIDPRQGTLLSLVAMRRRAGWAPERALDGVQFDDRFLSQIARGLAGYTDVSDDAMEEARRIGAWAGVPGFTQP